MPTYPGISSGGGTIPLQSTAAARPAANTVAPGTIYWATDTGEISVTNLAASAWQQIARITPNLTLVGSVTWTAGASLNSSGAPAVTTPNPIDITAAGKGLHIAEGANAKQGTTG